MGQLSADSTVAGGRLQNGDVLSFCQSFGEKFLMPEKSRRRTFAVSYLEIIEKNDACAHATSILNAKLILFFKYIL